MDVSICVLSVSAPPGFPYSQTIALFFKIYKELCVSQFSIYIAMKSKVFFGYVEYHARITF